MTTRDKIDQEILAMHAETCAAHERIEAYVHTLESLLCKARCEIQKIRDLDERVRHRLGKKGGAK